MGMSKENEAYIKQLIEASKTTTNNELLYEEMAFVSGMICSLRIQQVLTADCFDAWNLRIKAVKLNHHARQMRVAA